MKKIHNLFLGCFITLSGLAQVNKCYTDKALSHYYQENAQLKKQMRNNENIVRNWIAGNETNLLQSRTNNVITIPVVFHVVYKNAAQNIHDSNLVRQINILNECYRRTNPNYSQTRSIFDTVSADTEIEFCLAQFDPNGNTTTGITRTSAPSSAAFDPLFNMDKVKSSTTNGVDPWPTDKYLNLWVCDMSFFGTPFVLGYATFPGSDPAKDGVVLQYNFVGYMTNSTSNELGRTAVHEVGHWLGMRHIWGDGQQSTPLCDSTDYVDDTPNADTASQQSCMIKNSCSNESPYWSNVSVDPPDMIENYMDYSYDACMTMFTKGQKMRMQGFLNTIRIGLLTSPAGCQSVGFNNKNELDRHITLFPNPVSEQLKINNTSFNKMMMYTIQNNLGQVVKSGTLNAMSNDISVAELNSGVYFIQISEGNNSVSKKFVKH